jgi:hypothetical protein
MDPDLVCFLLVIAALGLWALNRVFRSRRSEAALHALNAAWKADPEGQCEAARARRPVAPETLSATDLLAQLGDSLAGRTLMIAQGDFPFDGHRHLVLLDLEAGEPPRVLWEGLMKVTEVALLSKLAVAAEIWQGEADRFFSDKQWRFAYTVAPHPFRLYDRQGLRAAVDDNALMLSPVRGASRRVAIADIAHITAELSADWVKRGVAVKLKTGERMPILVRSEWSVELYMFYDGLELMCDTGWVHGIARELGQALQVPVETSGYFD